MDVTSPIGMVSPQRIVAESDARDTDNHHVRPVQEMSTRSRWQAPSPKVVSYVVAVAATLIAIVARMVLDPILGVDHPYVTFMLVIIFTAWYGGVGPSTVALILGFVCGAFLFVYPRGSMQIYGLNAQIALTLYLTVGIFSILSSESANRRATATALELMKKQKDLEHEIDERRQAQQAHIDLLRRLVSIQEEERRRISRELHDQCGQDLTAMRLALKYLEESLTVGETAGRQFKSLRDLLDQVGREMHHIAMELRPPALDELGLQMAIDGYLTSWSSRTGIPVDFESRGMERKRASADVDTALYRILQEALTNVARHADATRVSVILERSDVGVSVIIEDQGKGFDTALLSSHTNQGHLGVLGMRERIEAVGGSLEIESIPGTGTTVFARVPVGPENRTESNG